VPGPAWEPFGDPIVVEPGITSATTTAHGIRIKLVAESSTFSAADGLWVTTSLENVGNNALRWGTDGCEIHVGVGARTAVDWTFGAEQPEPFKTFKDWILERYSNWERFPVYLRATPDWAIDLAQFGCADLYVGHELKPGGRVQARSFIRAETGRGGKYGLPPSGPVLLSASFDLWYRGREDPDAVRHDPIVASLAVELTEARDPLLISPGQAVDVALSSSAVQDLLRAWPRIPQFAPVSLVFDPALEEWSIGLTYGGGTPGERGVIVVVDARSAAIIAVRDQP
jgi:hypothetical protein